MSDTTTTNTIKISVPHFPFQLSRNPSFCPSHLYLILQNIVFGIDYLLVLCIHELDTHLNSVFFISNLIIFLIRFVIVIGLGAYFYPEVLGLVFELSRISCFI